MKNELRHRGKKDGASKEEDTTAEFVEQKPYKGTLNPKASFAAEQKEHLKTWPTGIRFYGVVFAVIFFGFATRYYLIWEPNETVFDEVHFGGFTISYVTNEYFFDIHPPLGKLFLMAMGVLTDYDYSYDQYREIGQTYPDEKYIYLRCMAAFWGAWLPVLTLLVMKELKCSFQAAIVATSFIMFDGVIIVTSRHILTDSCLWFFGALSIYTCLRFWRVEDEGAGMTSLNWWVHVVMCGVALGGVTAVKWTGLGMVGMLGLVQICRCAEPFLVLLRGNDQTKASKLSKADVAKLRKRFITTLIGGIIMIAVLLVLYTATFVIHFKVLYKSGPGDAWHDSRFLSGLEGTGHVLQPDQVPYTMTEKILEIHRKMFEANSGVEGTHSYGSMWYEWPMMRVGMSYWVKHFPENKKREIFLGGNAAAYATTTVAVGFFLLYAASLIPSDDPLSPRQRHYGLSGAWLLFGYILNWLPYIKIARVCFLYHYVPSFYLAVLLAGLLLDKYFRHNFDRTAVAAVLVASAAVYWGHQSAYYYAHLDLDQ